MDERRVFESAQRLARGRVRDADAVQRCLRLLAHASSRERASRKILADDTDDASWDVAQPKLERVASPSGSGTSARSIGSLPPVGSDGPQRKFDARVVSRTPKRADDYSAPTMISPGKKRYIGAEYKGAEHYANLVNERFSLATMKDPARFLERVSKWASLEAYNAWKAAYARNDGSFLEHPVWGADRHLGGGQYLYGAMDDRFATNAQRVFSAPSGLKSADAEGKTCLVIGGWDGTEALLLLAMGAKSVQTLDEVPTFAEMAREQFQAWGLLGTKALSHELSLYDLNPEVDWQTFDLVYVPGVMYHLTDLPAAMLILWSILKPGGKLAFESCVETRSGRGNSANYQGPSLPGWNWWVPTAECFEALMHDCGFPDGRTVEMSGGRGWWVGTRNEKCRAISHGAAGFSRPELLKSILEKSHEEST
jgi:SAM-dependent methyltransferase